MLERIRYGDMERQKMAASESEEERFVERQSLTCVAVCDTESSARASTDSQNALDRSDMLVNTPEGRCRDDAGVIVFSEAVWGFLTGIGTDHDRCD